MSMSCRVPDDYEPDLEANAVVQVKRKVGSSSATPKEPRLKIVSHLNKRHVSKWSGIPATIGTLSGRPARYGVEMPKTVSASMHRRAGR